MINEIVNQHHGDNTNPPLVVANVNQAEVHRCQARGDWEAVAQIFIQAAEILGRAGVDAISFCANTPHKVYDHVASTLDVPLMHIADATAREILRQRIESVCFIGTKYSMTDGFLVDRIGSHGIQVRVPDDTKAIEELHRIIQQELTYRRILPDSKAFVTKQIEAMVVQGARGVVLGCTEFPFMYQEEDLPVPIFDTTAIHAQALANYVLGLDSQAV